MADRECQRVNELVLRLLDGASELAPEHRAEYLDLHLDPSLESHRAVRAEIERLLRYYDHSGILDLNPLKIIPDEDMARPALEPGELISSRFRIGRMIGSGGMGEVYEAEDLMVGQMIALKTIRVDQAGDPEQAVRFRRELLISRNLAHRNVCKVFEYDDIDRGEKGRLRIYTMELLRGETLAQRLASVGRLDPNAALAILEQVAAGLEEVHRSGIIHRDLKPSNIFLVRESDGRDRVVVMDFGLARNLTDNDLRQTRTGMVMGTRLYMAPEMGKSVGVYSDVYSFGVVALEIVTGSASPIVAPRSIVPSLDPTWDRALLACFNLDPAKRPASALEVVDMLRLRHRKWRKTAGVAGAAVVLIAAGAALWRWVVPAAGPTGGATQLTFDSGLSINPTSSADGKLMAYASDRAPQSGVKPRGDLNIWVMDTEKKDGLRQITDDSYDEDEPTLSGDGRLIAWRSMRDDTIYVRAVAGGPVRAVVKPGFTPRFSPDGTQIVYFTGIESQRTAPARAWVVPVMRGKPREIAPGFADARLPAWSPDGQAILFRGTREPALKLDAVRDWWIASLDGKSIRPTGLGGRLRSASMIYHESPVVWDGPRIIFAARALDSNNLWSIGFSSLLNLAIGAPQPVTSGPGVHDTPAILSGRRIAYSSWREEIHVWRLDLASGTREQMTSGPSFNTKVSSSSDGRTLVFGRRVGGIRRVLTADTRTGQEREIETNEFAVPFVSPDGRTTAISDDSQAASVPSIRLIDMSSGSRSPEYKDCGELRGWTPDSRQVLYLERKLGSLATIRALDPATQSRKTLISYAGVEDAAIARGGTMMAFTIRKRGIYSTIYVARLTPGGVTGPWTRITADDGLADKPTWSGDGVTVYFRARIDGFQCVWSQKLDPVNLTVAGEPRAVGHFHDATSTISLSHLSPGVFSLALGGNSLFVTVSMSDSSIWAAQSMK